MSDLIDRQAAIDAILRITNCKSVRELFEYNQEHHLTEMWSGGVNDAIDAVIGVESATDNNVSTKLSTDLASLGTDCISRQQAIDGLRDYLAGKRCPDDGTLTCRLIENEVINKLPSAQPMRGKWERDGHHIKCDQCGEWMCDRDREGWDIPKNFCPNCGAKMEVNNESN